MERSENPSSLKFAEWKATVFAVVLGLYARLEHKCRQFWEMNPDPPESAEALRKRYTSAVDDISKASQALRERCTSAVDDIVKTSEVIAKQIERLDTKEANWKALELKVKENAAHAAEKINLNVGGKTFCIAKSHLLSVDGSYFHAMLASGLWKPDRDGTYFIDRNPKHFNRVLDYLRTGELSFDGLRRDQIKTLRKTLDYLQLVSPQPPVVWDPHKCGSGLVLSEENRAVTGNGYQGSVRSLEPCVRYSVRTSGCEGKVMIGFAPDAGFDAASSLYNKCGWYLNSCNGTLYSQGGVSGKRYGTGRIASDSTVTCILDRESNSISYEVDGRSFGVAFANIPQVPVYAVLNFLGSYMQLNLVD